MALSWLRRLLEPDREQGLPSAYIIRQNEAYRLELGPGGNIDFLEFLQAVEQAEKLSAPDSSAALWQYLQAEVLYGGPLLASDPYDECFAPERERLQNTYLKVLTRIIESYEQQENWREGLAYAEKFLSVDPYAEAIYGVLMGFQARLGEKGRLVRTFEQYCTRLADDLGCPLSAELIDLYQSLMGKIEV